MSKKNILLICSAGMSTSLLARKMEEAAAKRGLDFEISATAGTGARDYFEENNVDLALLGPQLSFMKGDIERLTEGTDIPVGVIDMMIYGMMDGEKTLDYALELLED